MDFILLGTAQDGGFPHAGCRCPRCLLAAREPDLARHVASAAVVDPDTGDWLLIDPSPDLTRQYLGLAALYEGRADIVMNRVTVLVTHIHLGHYWGLGFFGREGFASREVDVYAGPRAAAFLRENHPFSRLVSDGNLVVRDVTPGQRLDTFVAVDALEVPHRAEHSETLAFTVQGPRGSVFYMPDADVWHTDAVSAAAAADHAYVDGTFYGPDEIPGLSDGTVPHPPVVTSFKSLQPALDATTRVVFTHFNHTNPLVHPDGEETRAVERAGFAVARDWECIEI